MSSSKSTSESSTRSSAPAPWTKIANGRTHDPERVRAGTWTTAAGDRWLTSPSKARSSGPPRASTTSCRGSNQRWGRSAPLAWQPPRPGDPEIGQVRERGRRRPARDRIRSDRLEATWVAGHACSGQGDQRSAPQGRQEPPRQRLGGRLPGAGEPQDCARSTGRAPWRTRSSVPSAACRSANVRSATAGYAMTREVHDRSALRAGRTDFMQPQGLELRAMGQLARGVERANEGVARFVLATQEDVNALRQGTIARTQWTADMRKAMGATEEGITAQAQANLAQRELAQKAFLSRAGVPFEQIQVLAQRPTGLSDATAGIKRNEGLAQQERLAWQRRRPRSSRSHGPRPPVRARQQGGGGGAL